MREKGVTVLWQLQNIKKSMHTYLVEVDCAVVAHQAGLHSCPHYEAECRRVFSVYVG